MKTTRQRITYIIKSIEQEIPEGDDVLGYEGINKVKIVDSLKESYDLLNALESFNDNFETVYLKRRIAKIYDQINKIFKEENKDKLSEKFDTLLDLISKLRFSIKETYISVAKEPIRTEAEIKKAKDSLVILRNELSEIRDINERILEIKNASEIVIENLKEVQGESIENKNIISEYVNSIEEVANKSNESGEVIEEWKAEFKALSDQINGLYKTSNSLNLHLNNQNELNDKNQSKIDGLLKQINAINFKNIDQQEEIQKTIEDANRHGMAGAFKKRKDELMMPLRFWTCATILSIGVLIWLSYSLIEEIIKDSHSMEQLIVKLPVFVSSVWLGWFCAKQYGNASRIREDYSYKYAISMAFEGYKKAARDVDEDMLKNLLSLTMTSISKSPLEHYNSKNNHGTPYNELFHNLTSSKSKKEEDEG